MSASTKEPFPKNHDRKLLVEGKDKHSIIHLTAHHGHDWSGSDLRLPRIEETDGVEIAIKVFGVSLKSASIRRIGVIVDADEQSSARWDALAHHLRTTGIPAPAQAPKDGWVADSDGRRVGIWIMPDNVSQGKLENFLSRLIPAGDPTWPWAQQAVTEAKTRGAPFRTIDTIKAELHTWLAWREVPGNPYGTAIKAKMFQPYAPEAAPFVDWFRRLFLEG